MERCGLDLFTFESKTYGLLVDTYSQFTFVKEFRKTPDTVMVTNWLESIFLTAGFCKYLRSDGGPQMWGGLEDYCRRAKIELEKSSVENPQSNGASKASVKQVKQVFAKCHLEGKSKEEGLFMMQATPRGVGLLSPMRLFYCREPRIPSLPACSDLRDKAAAGGARNQNKFERKERANLKTERIDTSPMELEVGLKVIMRNSKT